ncbi:hypothetical protein AMECASPLE_031002, partial [Ameca splendens]
PSPNPVPDMNRDSFHFPYPLKIKPLSHTSTRDTSLTQVAFLPAYMFICVYVGTLSFRKAKKDPLPATNCLSHSTLSLNPPRSGYFFPSFFFLLFLHLSMGGFVWLSEAQNTDSFGELNMILRNTP